ncbi:helix-turn-helix domain-containing protein [Ekhidna sp. MALMAid0563]|uniref:helix-turn-helix domain-containing protein n=1 Tax=Ekhidna sp. MALMAid0563 TaxID=3143937 RepID=UPI0032DFE984
MNQFSDAAELAANYVNSTNRHIFLTGKAGTGKTTFLRSIVKNTYKNAVVAAPTGIAAINAEGVTLHSLLQLPFGAFVPEEIPFAERNIQVNTPASLFREAKFGAQKRKLINELELLIIDEVSMLRADLLDCIDATLRHLRKRRFDPFGGLQVLFIGDLMQLPPVVKREEQGLLQQFYASPYFFDARVLKDNPPIRVELNKVYRQTDETFIKLLNRLRHNELLEDDVELLNEHYDADVAEKNLEGYIHLTTHNQKADKINTSRLADLDGRDELFTADIDRDFPENAYPNEVNLRLKEDAQVMFIKNDPSGKGQFFNGKIGRVSSLEDGIKVKFEDGTEVAVEQYEWENVRYVLSKETKEVEQKVLGTFKQYPVKLAWAVTIHKSQGLTFEKAILDLENTFAAGQLYVALSRLTSLDGLILSSPLPMRSPSIDDQLKYFIESFEDTQKLEKQFENDRIGFIRMFAERGFLFDPLLRELVNHKKTFNKDENRSLKQKQLPWTDELINDTFPLKEVGETFIRQVNSLLSKGEWPQLAERMTKASDYFTEQLTDKIDRITQLHRTLKTQSQAKTYRAELVELKDLFSNQLRQIVKLNLLIQHINEGKPLTKEALQKHSSTKQVNEAASKDKTPTAEITYEMYKEGKSIKVIAEERGLVEGTIESHLAKYVESGDLDASQFVKPTKLKAILKCYDEGLTKSGEIKGALPDSYTWGEIKMGIAHAQAKESKES